MPLVTDVEELVILTGAVPVPSGDCAMNTPGMSRLHQSIFCKIGGKSKQLRFFSYRFRFFDFRPRLEYSQALDSLALRSSVS